jgi:formylglycine-generating enzyme required for sulfatase activity
MFAGFIGGVASGRVWVFRGSKHERSYRGLRVVWRFCSLKAALLGRGGGKLRLGGIAAIFTALVLAGCGGQNKTPDKPQGNSGHGVIKTECGVEMVPIPGGEFSMGTDDGPVDVKPAHRVKVDGFLMDRNEITQEAYEKVVGKNPSRIKHPQNPVEQVTWTAAVKFCNARSAREGLTPCYNLKTWECDFAANGYRLATEAEWEYACRAGGTADYYFGARPEELKSYAWFEGNSGSKPHAVGQRKPNAWGLNDMAGNVWEWCNDFYGAKYYRTSPADNPRGPAQGEKRVLRGGAWSSSADSCTSWVRNCDEAGLTDVCLTMDSNGFRCVRRK